GSSGTTYSDAPPSASTTYGSGPSVCSTQRRISSSMRLPPSSVPRRCIPDRITFAAAALLTSLALAAPVSAQEPGQGLRVQRTWRLLAVGLGVGPSLRAERLLRRAERGLRRELPGLDVRFDVAHWRDVAPPSDGALNDDELVAFA